MNLLSFSRNYYEFTINCANILWIHFSIREITMTSLWINFNFCDYTMKSLSFSLIYHESFILFAKLLWIQYLFLEFTLKFFFISRIDDEFTFCFAISLWILYLYRLIKFSKSRTLIRIFLRTITRLYCIYILPSYNECTFCFTISQWIHSSLANSPRIGYLLLEFTTNSRFISQNEYKSTVWFFVWRLWIHLIREFHPRENKMLIFQIWTVVWLNVMRNWPVFDQTRLSWQN